MRIRDPAFGVVVIAALLIGPSSAFAKLPAGSTFEACGVSGCRAASHDEAFALQLKLIGPTIDHGSRPAPTAEHAWVRVDLKLGTTDSGTSMRSVTRDFPVVYAAGLLGVPRANDTYRWTKLDAGQSAAYEQLASAVSPFPAESLVELAPSGVERAEPGLTAHPSSDTDGFPIWIVAALAAGAGLVWLRSKSRPGMQHEPA